MNTNTLKKFAQETRKKLLTQVNARLEQVLTMDSAELREQAAAVSKLQTAINDTSKAQVVEKVAYTWFNRLMALRFMDANDYQPIGIRVVTPKDGYTLPELLDEAKRGQIPAELSVPPQRIYDLLDGNIPSSNPENEAYKLLLIGACNHLHKVFPFLFERINSFGELLLPSDLTSEFSVVQAMRDGMTAEDCQEVEIIGWLYQFYISERKDEVFAAKSKVQKEDIPAATQLFTPRWIVEYMVQNTLGKLWLQNKPNSNLRQHMPYFIESPSVESDDFLEVKGVEEITLLDQACGSGHILVYAFDLFTKIYEEEGYNPSEIPQLIMEKNLYGFEIDERAAQLAGLALMMKARSYHRRVFRKALKPNILRYKDLNLSEEEIDASFQQLRIDLSKELKHDLLTMQQAANFGSLIIPHTSLSELAIVLKGIHQQLDTTDLFLKNQLEEIKRALNQLVQLGGKYHCVVDNPPYMGGGKMNKEISNFVKKNYPDSKADLMTCFMESGLNALYSKGFLGMINLPSWLFLSSFEKLRSKLLKNMFIDSLLHMGRGIFGIDWGSTAFVIKKQKIESKGKYFRLHKRNFQHLYPNHIRNIFLKAQNDNNIRIDFDKYRDSDTVFSVDRIVNKSGLKVCYSSNQKNFEKIPGNPIGYWLGEGLIKVFENNVSLSSELEIKAGLQTGKNDKFLRLWYEVQEINFSAKKNTLSNKWYPYNKGGGYQKWYGNQFFVINWKCNGKEIRNYKGAVLRNETFYFKEGITWSDVSAGSFACRYTPNGFLFDVKGSSGFSNNRLLFKIGFLNSILSTKILYILNPTMSYQVGNIQSLPFYKDEKKEYLHIDNLVKKLIITTKKDYDSSETSWDFQNNELLNHKTQDLKSTYESYCQYWRTQFHQLHKNEEELNRQFIKIYDLEDELTPDVPLEDITILKQETSIENSELVFHADEVIRQFISYAVGCMFGRYSLDKEGLILSNQGKTLEDYLKNVDKTVTDLSFMPDDDNIIPVLEDEWFEDDIVGRFYEFLKVTFGKAQFDENLAFVEDSLGKSIRKYFVKDFYNDHIKRYKKRPIYWSFASPKGSFSVLIYLHRYTPDTLNQILNGYLVEYREKLRTHIEQLEHIKNTGSAAEQNKATKTIDKLKVVLLELQEYERDILYPLATERIKLDLDDGVLVNYNKFGKAIKEVKGLNDKKAKAKVRKFDWIEVAEIRD